jgi:hypothetical protein
MNNFTNINATDIIHISLESSQWAESNCVKIFKIWLPDVEIVNFEFNINVYYKSHITIT